MNILIVANHYAVCSARYAADAFTRLGHTVKHVGPAMGRSIWGMQVPQEYVWEPDTDFSNGVSDLTIVMDSDPAVLDYGDWLTDFGSEPTVVWGVDNHVRDYRRPDFDHYFLAHKSVSVMPWRNPSYFREYADGIQPVPYEDMTWLPCAYDPIAFPPSPIPWEQRQYDVCMIGVMYPKRWELVNAMRAAGLKVLAGTGLVYEAYKEAHWNSRVALISSFNGDLPIRLFEGCGMGCAVLYDKIADLDYLKGYEDIGEGYSDIPSAVEMAKWLQDKPEYAMSARLWAQDHTWEKRCQVIIDWLEARS